MKQYRFEENYQDTWQALEALLQQLESKKKKRLASEDFTRFSHLYRQTCYHYSLAQSRQYSPYLVEKLHDLVMRAHQHFYSKRRFHAWRIFQFIFSDFPVMVRKNARLLWLSAFLLFGPGITLGMLCYHDTEFIYTVMSQNQVVEMESMYDPGKEGEIGRIRGADTDLYMFGHYIQNNISIGFRTFAGGLFFGIGTVATLLFNGVFIGAVAGHLTQLGYGVTFWSFVSGHSALELMAICVCGAAGLRLALALFAPGRHTRLDALRLASKQAFILVMGGAAMLLAAAFVEAFWSSIRTVAPEIKYAVGGVFWLLVALYFTLSGRRHGS